ncbi:hypothetical protein H0H93_016010 [Arthromyces matolae]|nr:hypothetical protein H0H93_016010 [Arthromyces matolae]
MPATWKWSQSSTGTIVADIAFDIFTSATSGGSNAYEIMIWLANYNAGPISYNYDSSGNPVAVATGVSLAGQTWNVYYGSNGANYVYSFLPASGSTITSFSGDLYTFFQYLISSQGLSSAQYLTTLQAGTEATSGSATLTTSAYSAVVSSGASSSSPRQPPPPRPPRQPPAHQLLRRPSMVNVVVLAGLALLLVRLEVLAPTATPTIASASALKYRATVILQLRGNYTSNTSRFYLGWDQGSSEGETAAKGIRFQLRRVKSLALEIGSFGSWKRNSPPDNGPWMRATVKAG